MKMLLVPWADKPMVCACGEEFDTFGEVKTHANTGHCPINPPEMTYAWVHWIMAGPGRRQYKPEMTEEKKAELKAYYEEHKDEILARRRLRAKRMQRILEATKGGRRGKTLGSTRS